MRHFKSFVIALAIIVGSSSFAATNNPTSTPDKMGITELSNLLEDDQFYLNKDLNGKVVFSINEKNKIIIHSVLCQDKNVRNYLEDKLENRKLFGEGWEVGKVYILPVKMKMVS